jgi:hypothetical protein
MCVVIQDIAVAGFSGHCNQQVGSVKHGEIPTFLENVKISRTVLIYGVAESEGACTDSTANSSICTDSTANSSICTDSTANSSIVVFSSS